jgi:hypothetical protein
MPDEKGPGNRGSPIVHSIRLEPKEWEALNPSDKARFSADQDLVDLSTEGKIGLAKKLRLPTPERATLEDILRAKGYIS